MIGVAVGTGFAVLETMGYAFVALLQSGGNVGAAEQTLFIRGLLSPAGHAAWTGLTCWGLWRFVLEPTGKRFAGFLGMYALAVALHTTWDGIGGRITYAVVGAISHRPPALRPPARTAGGHSRRTSLISRRASRSGRRRCR